MRWYLVRSIKHDRVNRRCRIRFPRVQFDSVDAQQAAGGVHPNREGVVLDEPMHCIAGQAIFGRQGRGSTILYAAEAAFGGGPKGPLVIDVKIPDSVRAQAVFAAERCVDFTVLEVGNPSLKESQPQSSQRVGYDRGNLRTVLLLRPWPRRGLDDASVGHMKQPKGG